MDNIGREDEIREFKESTVELEKGINSLVAMLNKSCRGEVLFGVKDNGDIIGMDVGKTTLRHIAQKVDEMVEPAVIPKIEVLRSRDGRSFISLSARGTDRPYMSKGAIYIRSGEEDRRAPLSELKRMVLSTGDTLRDTTSLRQDLTFNELVSLLRSKGLTIVDDELMHRNLEMCNSEGKFNQLGSLMSDQNSIPLTVVIFGGLDRTSMQVRTDYGGHSMIVESQMVLDYVAALNERYVRITDSTRHEMDLFDAASFKEAWVNACIHNNWLTMIPPTVHVFDDRMEVISYGSKPYWLTDEEFFNGRSMPVNEALMRIFISAHMSEHTGHGVPIIVGSYGREAFDITDGSIRVTLRFTRNRIASDFREWNGIRLSEKEETILRIIIDDPAITQERIASLVGASRKYVSNAMKKLKDNGLIEREGSNKNGIWVVKGGPGVPEDR